MFNEIAFTGIASANANATSALCFVGVGRNSFNPATVRNSHDDLVFLDELFDIKLISFTFLNLGKTVVTKLVSDFNAVFTNDVKNQLVVSKDSFVAFNFGMNFSKFTGKFFFCCTVDRRT